MGIGRGRQAVVDRQQRREEAVLLGRALGALDAWITGIRRDQAPTRANTPKVEYDEVRGIWKFSAVARVGDAEVASASLMVAPETGKAAP